MDSRNRTRSLSFAGRFCRKNAQNVSFECRKCAKQRQLRAFRDKIQNRVPAAPAWAAWRVSLRCGWAARRTAVLRISGCYRQTPERISLGTGFGRSVQSRSTWFAAWAWWTGRCVHAARSGPAWMCSGSTLQYSTFRSLLLGTAGPVNGSGQWSVVSGRWSVAGERRSNAGPDGDGHARPHRPCLRRRHAGIAHTRWHRFPVADTSAGDAHARWHSCRGALRGESPRTREGRNGTTGQRQLPVVSGQWAGTAGTGL